MLKCTNIDPFFGECPNDALPRRTLCEIHETKAKPGRGKSLHKMLMSGGGEEDLVTLMRSLINEIRLAFGHKDIVSAEELVSPAIIADQVKLPEWIRALINEIPTAVGRASAMPVTKAAPAAEKTSFEGVALLESPTRRGPMRATPVKKIPAKKTSAKKAPAKKAPAKKAAAKKAPAKKAPAKKAPAKKAAAKKAAAKKSAR